jgi:hypothetical protein
MLVSSVFSHLQKKLLLRFKIGMRQPGIEPGAHRWQRWILPLNHWRTIGKNLYHQIQYPMNQNETCELST